MATLFPSIQAHVTHLQTRLCAMSMENSQLKDAIYTCRHARLILGSESDSDEDDGQEEVPKVEVTRTETELPDSEGMDKPTIIETATKGEEYVPTLPPTPTPQEVNSEQTKPAHTQASTIQESTNECTEKPTNHDHINRTKGILKETPKLPEYLAKTTHESPTQKTTDIFIGNANPTLSPETLMDHLRSRVGVMGKIDIKIVVTKPTYRSFKVTIPAGATDRTLNQRNWPRAEHQDQQLNVQLFHAKKSTGTVVGGTRRKGSGLQLLKEPNNQGQGNGRYIPAPVPSLPVPAAYRNNNADNNLGHPNVPFVAQGNGSYIPVPQPPTQYRSNNFTTNSGHSNIPIVGQGNGSYLPEPVPLLPTQYGSSNINANLGHPNISSAMPFVCNSAPIQQTVVPPLTSATYSSNNPNNKSGHPNIPSITPFRCNPEPIQQFRLGQYTQPIAGLPPTTATPYQPCYPQQWQYFPQAV